MLEWLQLVLILMGVVSIFSALSAFNEYLPSQEDDVVRAINTKIKRRMFFAIVCMVSCALIELVKRFV